MRSKLVKRIIFSKVSAPRSERDNLKEVKMEDYEVSIRTNGADPELDVMHSVSAETPLFALNQVLLDIQSQAFSDDTRQWLALNQAADIELSVKLVLGR